MVGCGETRDHQPFPAHVGHTRAVVVGAVGGLRLAWPQLALQCHLSVADQVTSEIHTPTVTRVRLTPAGEHIHLSLPVGMNPTDLTDKAEVLAHALGTSRPLRVEITGARTVGVQVQRRNPLDHIIQPLAVDDSLDIEVLKALPVGRTETGETWRLPVWGSHIFCGGLTGSGKGSILWSLLHALAPFIREGIVQVWALDPKGGMELEPGAPLFARFERDDLDGMADLLEQAVETMDYRCRSVRGHTRLVTPTRDMPLIVLLVDELASLTSLCGDRKIGARIERALGLLTTKGRAPGFSVVAFTQEVSKETARWRDLFPTKIALRLAKPVEVDMVLGDGAWMDGAQADTISRHLSGSGYVLSETSATPVAVRASWHDDHAIAALARDYAPQQLPLPLPGLTPVPEEPNGIIEPVVLPVRKPRTPRRTVTVPATASDLSLTG